MRTINACTTALVLAIAACDTPVEPVVETIPEEEIPEPRGDSVQVNAHIIDLGVQDATGRLTFGTGDRISSGRDLEVSFRRCFFSCSWVRAYVVTPNSGYASAVAGTRWIGPAPNSGRTNINVGSSTFVQSFFVRGGVESVRFTIDVHADNSADVFVNGHRVGRQPGGTGKSNFQGSPSRFVTTNPDFFRNGINQLKVIVDNPGGPSPTALNYRVQVDMTCAEGFVLVSICTRPPVAVPGGPYEAGEGERLTLDGSASHDPDEDPLFFHWSGAASSAGALVGRVYDDDGEYDEELQVRDRWGAADDATAQVIIHNLPPRAVFVTPDEVEPGEGVELMLTGVTDPGAADRGAGFTYAFDCGSGTLTDAPEPTFTCEAPVPGTTLTMKARIMDKDGGFAVYEAEVGTVNVAPTATFVVPSEIKEGETFVLRLADLQDTPLDAAAGFTYAFDCGTGAMTETTSPELTCTADDDGTLHVAAIIRDQHGASSEYDATVNVTNAPPSATALSGPTLIDEGGAIVATLIGATDPSSIDRATLQYSFACGDSGFGSFSSSTEVRCDAADGPDAVQVGARVRDEDGAEGPIYTLNVEVVNVAPRVNVTGPTELFSGDVARVDGTFSDPGTLDAPWQYVFDWGDIEDAGSVGAPGSISSERRVLRAGAYVVRVTVADKDRDSGHAEHAFTVHRLRVAVDVKPGSAENPVNLRGRGNGRLPVALLSGDIFDATAVDVATVRAGAPNGVAPAQLGNGRLQVSFEDANGDGRADLVMHFTLQELERRGYLSAGESSLSIFADLRDGRQIEGSDAVRILH